MRGEMPSRERVPVSRRSFIAGMLTCACALPAAMLALPERAVALPASASQGAASSYSAELSLKASSRRDGKWGSAGSSAGADSSADSAGNVGNTAESNRKHRYEDIPKDAFISAQELYDLVQSGAVERREAVVLDIRSHRDFQNQMIAGSRNIPAGRQIDIRMDEIPRDRPVVLVALKSSNRLAETWYTLIGNGYDSSLVKVLSDGLTTWIDAGYPTLEDQFLGC